MHRILGKKLLQRTNLALFATFCVIRFVFAFAQRSSFHADEHWQGPEVAYRMVFGSTDKTWEWLDTVALRSHLHPLMFAIPYYIAAALHLDSPLVIAYGPRFVQGVLTAIGDLCFYLIAKKVAGVNTSALATTCYITSWFSVYTLCRTTSNAADTAITLLGLYYYTVNLPVLTALAAAVCFIMRPPSALFWLPICISISLSYPLRTTARCLLAALLFILGVCCLDRWCYGVEAGWLAPWNFLKYNIVFGIAKEYGEDPWHYYLLSFFSHYLVYSPWVIREISRLPRPWLFGLALSFVVLSFSSHKELRFITPLFAVVSLSAGPGLFFLSKFRLVMLASAAIHAGAAVYGARLQGLAGETITASLRYEAKPDDKVLFLGCHQSPFNAFMHMAKLKLSYLDCSPYPVRTSAVSDRDLFQADPVGWLRSAEGRKVEDFDWVVVDSQAQQNEEFMYRLKSLGDFQDIKVLDGLVGDDASGSGVVFGSFFRLLKRVPVRL